MDPPNNKNAVAPAVRHAEKRRKSSCRFADRMAQFCVDHYGQCVPSSFRDVQKQTCMAAIVALIKSEHNDTSSSSTSSTSQLYMVGMGVGTKFLARDLLLEQEREEMTSTVYGTRVRDCHAEVLARRAFRRQLLLEMRQDLLRDNNNNPDTTCLLEREMTAVNGRRCYRLKPGISLHMYTSSAPCGNATLKKFATMKQVKFNDSLTVDQWPTEPHEPIEGHSMSLGQFALLVKKDPGSSSSNAMVTMHSTATNSNKDSTNHNNKWPANKTTDWCPPGTSTVWSNQGTIHTCSDKLCRWNCLGLQGSLLASLLQQPLYMSTLTVGRKLTECICRRAVCCRATTSIYEKKRKRNAKAKGQTEQRISSESISGPPSILNDQCGRHDKVNHPAILGTQVYMDDSGVIDMSRQETGKDQVEGQDVRFHSSASWAWWPSIGNDGITGTDDAAVAGIECIDGATGFAIVLLDKDGTVASVQAPHNLNNPLKGSTAVSRLSTQSLLDLHFEVAGCIDDNNVAEGKGSDEAVSTGGTAVGRPTTLAQLRSFKRQVSPQYEAQKQELLTEHPLLRQWNRREAARE